MIDKIISALKEKENVVCYGTVKPEDLECDKWNYIVITKDSTEIDNGGRWWDYYIITIVREGYIPEDYPLEVMDLVEKSNVRRASKITYNYYQKGSTEEIIETATFKVKGVRRPCS